MSQFVKNARFIGAAAGQYAGIKGCEHAPEVLREKLSLDKQWKKTIVAKQCSDQFDDLSTFSQALADTTQNVLKTQRPFITFGGDHSCAIGTWSGVANACSEFGLIWVDAHMDAHTPETSETGNIHGMPVACLLGHGDTRLTNLVKNAPALKPENIIMIGIRSFESGEAALLKNLGVKIHMMPEVDQYGFEALFQQAVHYFQQKQLKFGVSFDVDGLDPKDFPATGIHIHNGIRLPQVLKAFNMIPLDELIGFELVEYNPTLDTPDHQCIEKIKHILASLP